MHFAPVTEKAYHIWWSAKSVQIGGLARMATLRYHDSDSHRRTRDGQTRPDAWQHVGGAT